MIKYYFAVLVFSCTQAFALSDEQVWEHVLRELFSNEKRIEVAVEVNSWEKDKVHNLPKTVKNELLDLDVKFLNISDAAERNRVVSIGKVEHIDEQRVRFVVSYLGSTIEYVYKYNQEVWILEKTIFLDGIDIIED